MALSTRAVCECDCADGVSGLRVPDDDEVDDWVRCQCFECGPLQDGQRQCSIRMHPRRFLWRAMARRADITEPVGDYCEVCEEHRLRCKYGAKRRRVEVARDKSIPRRQNTASEGKQSPQLERMPEDMTESLDTSDGKAPKT